jgi:hypothetical protein
MRANVVGIDNLTFEPTGQHPEHPLHGGGNHVPDAGSTMGMLGMALCALSRIAFALKLKAI